MGDEPVVPVGAVDGREDGEAREVELVPNADASTTRVQRGRRVTLLVDLAVVVVGGLGAAVLLAGGGETDPDETLAAAQAAAAEATSFRFTLDSESAMSVGNAQNGTDTTTRFSGDGAWAGTRWQTRSGGGLVHVETIIDGTTTYTRFADAEGAVDDELWQRYESEPQSRQDLLDELDEFDPLAEEGDDEELDFPDDEGFQDTMAVALAQSVYLGPVDGPVASVAVDAGGPGDVGSVAGMVEGGFAADPGGFLGAIERMGGPVLVDEANGVTTLAATLEAPADLTEAYGRPLPDATVELDVGADDVPVALRLDVASGASSSSLEITFSGWNEPVEITIPPEDQVDANPMVDEEGLLALRDLALVWPTEPPDGWELTIYSPDETADMEVIEGDCEVVELDWDDWSSESDEGAFLWIVERPVACALAADPTPFRPGGPGGLPSRPGTAFGSVEVQVGDTAVAVESTLQGAELETVLASLAPVDAETLIAAVPATFG